MELRGDGVSNAEWADAADEADFEKQLGAPDLERGDGVGTAE